MNYEIRIEEYRIIEGERSGEEIGRENNFISFKIRNFGKIRDGEREI